MTTIINLVAAGASGAHVGQYNVANKKDLILAIQQGWDYAQSDPSMWDAQEMEVYVPGKGYIGSDTNIPAICEKLGLE